MRVLVVDDEVRLAEAVGRGLAAEGFEVELCHDGLDALWRAKERDYGAIVLDLLLPGMNGYQVCRQLREAGVWTPILMLTAKSGEYDEAEALDTGADDFLSKPFAFVVLVARLRALLRRGRTERAPELRAGELRLDPASHEVWRGDAQVSLSPRQFSLLEFFMRRAGEVLPKQVILEHVWDFAFDGDPNIVEVYISQLRRRIDEPFGRASLQTVRGAGYRLDPQGG